MPYDPYLYFFGEEITLAVRLWTHGWDIYYPNILIVFHDWKRHRRRTHFQDHHAWERLDSRSVKRALHLLGSQRSNDPDVLQDLSKYGLGTERTLDQYQAYSGVNFYKKHFSDQARRGDPYPPFIRSRDRAHRNSRLMSKRPKTHHPKKVFESPGGIVFDDFLPEDIYQQVYHYACVADYERINTSGRVKKVWRIRDGFPLRSRLNLFYFADESKRPDPKPDWAYPTTTTLDHFAEHLSQLASSASRYIGNARKDWIAFRRPLGFIQRDRAVPA